MLRSSIANRPVGEKFRKVIPQPRAWTIAWISVFLFF